MYCFRCGGNPLDGDIRIHPRTALFVVKAADGGNRREPNTFRTVLNVKGIGSTALMNVATKSLVYNEGDQTL